MQWADCETDKGRDQKVLGVIVQLRVVCQRDLPKLIAWDNDSEVSALAGKKFSTKNEAKDWYLNRSPINKKSFVIETLQGKPIGEIEIVNISWRLHTGELRVVIGEKQYWNRGFGTDAVLTLCKWVFESYSIDTIYLRVDKKNYRARRCYAKVGFKPIGCLKFSADRKNTKARTRTQLILMQITKTEFLSKSIMSSV